MNSNLMALCSEKVKEALNQVSGGLGYFTAEAKHAQLLDVQKTLSEIEDALASPEAVTQPPNALPARVLTMCKERGWDLSWSSRGVYLHLEASELIEALRGKHGEPLTEAADVLLVLMSITENAGIPWCDVLNQTAMTCARLEVCEPYPGEERGALARPESEQIPPGPYSEHDLRTQWNAQADEYNQWESLDLSEQLAWAQACAVDMSEYTDSEWAEIKRGEQESSATQPASPVLPAGGLVERLRTSVRRRYPQGVYLLDSECQVAIREVAAWLDLEGYNRAANDLRDEAGR